MDIALDSETFLMFPGYLAPEMVCVSFAHPDGSGVYHSFDPDAWACIETTLRSHHSIYAFSSFDLAVFAAKRPDLLPAIFQALDEGRIHDVLLREKLIDIASGNFRFEEDEDGNITVKGYSLFEVAKRRLGVILDKDEWRLKYHTLWKTPVSHWPQGAIQYAAHDAEATLAIKLKQDALCQKMSGHLGFNVLGNEAAQVQASFALHLTSCHGFRTSGEAVDRLEARVRKDLDELVPKLVAEGLVRLDGTRDTKAAIRRMVLACVDPFGAPDEVPQVVLTKAGMDLMKNGWSYDQIVRTGFQEGKFISVSEEACNLSGDDVLVEYSRYTRLRNLLTGSIKHLRAGTTLPIQSRFEVLMETGRTSSSNPNIQNLRRAPGVRECFIPRAGNVLIACDYSQAELHTLAQCCYDYFGFSKLGDALNAGIDVHVLVASRIANIEYEEAFRLYQLGDVEIKNLRQLSKALNFGLPGGCSAKRFVGIAKSFGVSITVHEAARLKALWFQMWPEMRLYFEFIESCEDGQGWHYVMQNRVERLRMSCSYTAACNSHFQGLAADGAKRALYAVVREQYTQPDSPLWGTRCVVFVHDEILIECPEERRHAAAMRLKEIMEIEFNKFVPNVPTHAEPTAMRYWSKAAKSVYNEEGELEVWEDKKKAA